MKWFKHQSTARNDEKIARLEDKCGIEGYGFYFKMLELVAEVIDSTDRCEVTYSVSRWGRQANVTTKKFLFLAQCCADVGLMIVQRYNDDMTINIPNLLKYRDNHTKNLQATSKQEKEEYKEEKEKEEDIKDLSHPAKKPAEKKPSEKKTATLEIFEFWKDTMNHKGAQLDADREKYINNALKAGYSPDQLKAAILGCSVTPHNCGENDTGKRYDGLGVIFRNADNIDRFIQNSIHPVPAKPGLTLVGERQRKVLN